MNIVSGFDPESNMVILNITSNIISDYYYNFAGLIKSNPSSPQGIKVSKKGNNTAMIQFPLPKEAKIKRIDDTKAAVSVDMGNLSYIINEAVKDALRYKVRHTEFLPLSGYPLEDLQIDVKNAISNKRNFCILRDYQEYLDSGSSKDSISKYRFNQYYVNYGTSEYSDIAISIINGEMEELINQNSPKIEFQDWV